MNPSINESNVNSVKAFLKETTAYLPIVSALLIFLGYYDRFIYFRFLKIDIHDLLEPTELIFSFGNLLYDLVDILIYVSLFSFLWNLVLSRWRIEKALFFISFFVFCIGMISILVTLANIRHFDFGVSQRTIIITFIALSIVLLKGVDIVKERFDLLNSVRVKIWLGFTSLMLFISVKNEVLAARLVYGHSKEFEVELSHEIPNIPKRTSDSIAYVGVTRKYHFMINVYTRKIFYIPCDKVTVVTFEEK